MKRMSLLFVFLALIQLNLGVVNPAPERTTPPGWGPRPNAGPLHPAQIHCSITTAIAVTTTPTSGTISIAIPAFLKTQACPSGWMTGGTTAAANNAINMTVVISYRSANELGIIIAPDAAEVAATARGANFFLPEKETWPTSKRKPVAITNTSSFNYYVTVPPDGVTLSFVVRNRNQLPLFDTRGYNILLSNLISEIGTAMQNEMIYGLGERRRKFRMTTGMYTLWCKDQYATNDNGGLNSQTYGFHPTYLHREMTKNTFHIAHVRNPTGAVVDYIEHKSLVWRFLTGQLQLYFWFGDSDPEMVVQLYHEYLNGWILHPFWAGGWMQSKYGYNTSTTWRAVWQSYIDNRLPLDVMNTDIEYMMARQDFTFNTTAFLPADMVAVTNRTNVNGIHWVPIMDAGVFTTEDIGVKVQNANAVIQSGYYSQTTGTDLPNPTLYHGCVWPGIVYFLDFQVDTAAGFWAEGINKIQGPATTTMSGIWLDMNEVASFVRGEVNAPAASPTELSNCVQNATHSPVNSCSQGRCGRPPAGAYDYLLDIGGTGYLEDKVISLNAFHVVNGWDTSALTIPEYLYHNLNGHLYMQATYWAFMNNTGNTGFVPWNFKLVFILSRATMFGSGRYGQHWTGDNSSTWDDYRFALAEILNFNIFGIPFSGPDVCGFAGNTTAELCARWHAISPWYTFARNHNGDGNIQQEPYAFPNQTYVLIAAKYALALRYQLMKYHYTRFLLKRGVGSIVYPIFYLYPEDSNLYDMENQYMFGDFLISQISTQGNAVLNKTQHTVYLPNDQWFDYETGVGVQGPVFMSKMYNFSQLHPAYLRGGSIVYTQREGALRARLLSNKFQLQVALKYNVATGNYEAVGYLPTLADLNDETKVDTLCVKANCLAMVTAAIRWGQTQVNITLAGSMTRRVNWGGIEVASDAAAIKAPDAWDGGFVVDTVEVMGLPGYSDRKIVVRVNRTYTGPANFTIRVPAGEILMRTLKLLIVGVAIFANF